ncbi:MAG: hypothetical protein ACREIC_20800 [Limisphaerales bacterium]
MAGYILQLLIPSSSLMAVGWNGQQYYIPYSAAVFWGCVALGIIAGTIQAIRELMREMDRLE